MNQLLFLPEEQISSKENQFIFELTGAKEQEHLKNVLKTKVGDQINAAIVDLGQAKATLLNDLGPKGGPLFLIENLKPLNPPWASVIVGLSRPQTMKKILEHGATMGVGDFHFIKTQLSEKSYADSKLWKNEHWKEFTLAGLSQSGLYSQCPLVQIKNYFTPLHPSSKNKFLLSIGDHPTFVDYYQSQNLDLLMPTIIALGPERGFTIQEEEAFIQNGFKPIKLSSTILRVEYALSYALAQLELLKINSNNIK